MQGASQCLLSAVYFVCTVLLLHQVTLLTPCYISDSIYVAKQTALRRAILGGRLRTAQPLSRAEVEIPLERLAELESQVRFCIRLWNESNLFGVAFQHSCSDRHPQPIRHVSERES
jgi:hypothetical protein